MGSEMINMHVAFVLYSHACMLFPDENRKESDLLFVKIAHHDQMCDCNVVDADV